MRAALGRVEPLAGGYLPLQALMKADGWILFRPTAKAIRPARRVIVRPWP